MSTESIVDEMGPIDYLLVEWPGRRPSGEVEPAIFEGASSGLLERGVLNDVEFEMAKARLFT